MGLELLYGKTIGEMQAKYVTGTYGAPPPVTAETTTAIFELATLVAEYPVELSFPTELLVRLRAFHNVSFSWTSCNLYQSHWMISLTHVPRIFTTHADTPKPLV